MDNSNISNKNNNVSLANQNNTNSANENIQKSQDINSNLKIEESNVINSEDITIKTNEVEDLDLVWSRWKCLVCGYIYEGRGKITKCPRCGNSDPDKFNDAD